MDFESENISRLEFEIQKLRLELDTKEKELVFLKNKETTNPFCNGLTKEEISRYSRQMIMPQITINGQRILKNSKVLIAGTGGLGCPSALYLAAAGVGYITLIDNDHVELSNLHRQVLHMEQNLGKPKSFSGTETLKRLNSNVNITPLQIHLDSSNIVDILTDFDVVVDGSDNVATRYLLNDACVIKKKPLVSGSALQMEGQLTVYNYKGGPCYRCIFPEPPPPETVTSCGDGGVLGVVPGTIGILQALETIKILLDMPDTLSGRFLLFDGSNTTFRNIKLRNRNPKCAVCGDEPTIKNLIDYEQFCHANAHDHGNMIKILSQEERMTVTDYDGIVKNKINHVLLDVRASAEYDMCSLPNSVNIPYSDIEKKLNLDQIKNAVINKNSDTVIVLCRRGNDSQRAVNILKKEFENSPWKFKDIIGGLHSYSAKIDSRFPVY